MKVLVAQSCPLFAVPWTVALQASLFHAKMGSIKDRNDMDLTEAKDIKKGWQEYTKNCTKNFFITQISTMV